MRNNVGCMILGPFPKWLEMFRFTEIAFFLYTTVENPLMHENEQFIKSTNNKKNSLLCQLLRDEWKTCRIKVVAWRRIVLFITVLCFILIFHAFACLLRTLKSKWKTHIAQEKCNERYFLFEKSQKEISGKIIATLLLSFLLLSWTSANVPLVESIM